MFSKPITSIRLILLAAAFFTAATNYSFFSHLLKIYPAAENPGFLLSFVIGYLGFNIIILSLLCFRHTLKPVLILLFICSASAAYFMDRYDIVIDANMLDNAMNTDPREVSGLFSFTLVFYILLLGVLPSAILLKMQVVYRSFIKETALRFVIIAGILLYAGVMVWSFNGYFSFFREHKDMHHYANPAGYVAATAEIVKSYFKKPRGPIKEIGAGAHIPPSDKTRELIIFVVGETTRADRFSLNGYGKPTNPLLGKEEVYSFTNVWSCGTSTLVSVPCMFSNIGDQNFERGAAGAIENAMDVLKHAGVNTLWRDNNSSSKGVAERMKYESFLTPDVNTICDAECRDEGMLVGLQEYVNSHPKGDIFIILHQMGSHGPGYYLRYPKSFEKFTPACHTNELKDCTLEEISNAYDNTILYTDYFLSKVIAFLKRNDGRFETGMLFVGDHGESLGENGIYLHGMPMMFAPDEQRHVPAIIWLGKHYEGIDRKALAAKRDRRYSHENVFHTLLGFAEIQTDVYDPKKDMLRD